LVGITIQLKFINHNQTFIPYFEEDLVMRSRRQNEVGYKCLVVIDQFLTGQLILVFFLACPLFRCSFDAYICTIFRSVYLHRICSCEVFRCVMQSDLRSTSAVHGRRCCGYIATTEFADCIAVTRSSSWGTFRPLASISQSTKVSTAICTLPGQSPVSRLNLTMTCSRNPHFHECEDSNNNAYLLCDLGSPISAVSGDTREGSVLFWATICKTVCPVLSDRCLSVCLSVCLRRWCIVAKRLDGSIWNLACR